MSAPDGDHDAGVDGATEESSESRFDPERAVASLPTSPGVYLMIGDGEKVLYVGKGLLPARLQQLHPHFSIVWSTSWQRSASYDIAPLVGLPEGLPHIDFDSFPGADPGQSRKFPGLSGWVKDRAVAIVDDEIGADLEAWACARQSPTLLVPIDPRLGLQDCHVKRLLGFSLRCRMTHP